MLVVITLFWLPAAAAPSSSCVASAPLQELLRVSAVLQIYLCACLVLVQRIRHCRMMFICSARCHSGSNRAAHHATVKLLLQLNQLNHKCGRLRLIDVPASHILNSARVSCGFMVSWQDALHFICLRAHTASCLIG